MKTTKKIKYLYLSYYKGQRFNEKQFNNINEIESYISRYIGFVKDYFLASFGKNYSDYSVECETKNGIRFLWVSLVYEV